MKQLLLLCFIFSFGFNASAQLGITTASTRNQSTEWQVVTENFVVHKKSDFLKYGTVGIIDYAFLLRNGDIRIRPAFEFFLANSLYQEHFFRVNSLGMQGNFEFALLSAKDKSDKKRAIRPFLQFSPGISYLNFKYEYPKDDITDDFMEQKSHRLAPNLGANLFFEVKLTPLLTVAPMAGFRIYPKLNWKDFTETVSKGMLTTNYDKTNWKQYQLGVRFGLSFK